MPYCVEISCDFEYAGQCANTMNQRPCATAPSAREGGRAAEKAAAEQGWTKRRSGDGWICPACKRVHQATVRTVNRAAQSFKNISAGAENGA